MYPKLSVIVPIYNVEKYLPHCIQSIINQVYQNLEIILINDGSTDLCLSICQLYEKRDSRIIVVNKTNGGLSSARNAGLDIATGDYVAFVDSDDFIDREMYSTMMEKMLLNNLSVVCCGVNYIYEKGEETKNNTNLFSVLNNSEAISSILRPRLSIRFEVWNKIFKREVIGKVRFKLKQVYEDVYFDRCTLLNVDRIGYLDAPYYNYLCHRDGNTNSRFNENRLCLFDELADFISDLKRKGDMSNCRLFQEYLLDAAISMHWDAKRLQASKEIVLTIRDTHEKYLFSYADGRKVNYIVHLIFKWFPQGFYYMQMAKYRKVKPFFEKLKVLFRNG